MISNKYSHMIYYCYAIDDHMIPNNESKQYHSITPLNEATRVYVKELGLTLLMNINTI